MAVGVLVLHINGLCEGLGHLADKGLGLLVLLHQGHGLPMEAVHDDERHDQNDRSKPQNPIPKHLADGLLLLDLNGELVAHHASRIRDRHHEAVGPALQVGVAHRRQVAAEHCGGLLIQPLQIIGDLRIPEGIGEYMPVDRQPVHIGSNADDPVLIRIDTHPVGLHIGHRHIDHGSLL